MISFLLFILMCFAQMNLCAMESSHYSEVSLPSDDENFYARPGAYDESRIIGRAQSAPSSPHASDDEEYAETVSIVPYKQDEPKRNGNRPRKGTEGQIKDADTLELSGGLIIQVNKHLHKNLDTLNDQLHAALFPQRGDPDLKKANGFIRAGADVNAVNKAGDPLIVEAVKHKAYEVVKFLIEKGANINKKGSNDVTALNKAVFEVISGNGYVGIVRFLVEKGADPNIPDDNGTTPLFYVVWIRNPEIAKTLARLLINAGADLLYRNKKPGHTVLDSARSLRDKEELINYLERKQHEQEVARLNKKKREEEQEARLVY